MSILDKIIECKKDEVNALRNRFKLSNFSDSAFFGIDCLSLIGQIRANKNISIISEVKKASPSKGIIREDFNHMDIARLYMEGGANAMSVLTDQNFFQGNISFLNDIAHIKTIPLLRKDFIIDIYQIYEAKANGADAILLISEALTKSEIADLTLAAKDLGLEVLLEIHSADQLNKIDFSLNKLIGINNRNLNTFVTDLQATIDLANCLPEEIVTVSESGINGPGSLNRLKETRTRAVLVGEYFMRKQDIFAAVKEFKKWCQRNED